ncbi:transposase family protein [Streptomyces sp. NPDC090741]|uniref:transposase family protein n=1 Tax=Streptomyces sp. NPDC090741 TaxID=3365967 RepID=UPI003825D3AE
MVLVMQTVAPFWDSLVFEGIDDVDVEAVTAAFGTVEVVARGRAAGAACPDCGCFSGRVHDRYQRRLKDPPLAEQGFVIRLTVRRFICGPGASGARAGRAGRRPAGCPAGLRSRPDDLVTQGHGLARSAVRYSAGAGRGRLRDPSRPDLLHRLDQRRRPSRDRRAPDP